MKMCCTCQTAKLFTDFHKNKSYVDGLHKQCKSCRKAGSARSYQRNQESISAKAKDRYEANRAVVIAASRAHVERNSERVAKRQAEYYVANREARRAYRKQHYEQNAERYMSAEASRRSLMRRLPLWADPQRIEAVYASARDVTRSTGIAHHVDHVIPLQGKFVCGLHVETNLRVVPASVNLAKKNRFEDHAL